MAGNKGIVPVNFYTFNAAAKTITFSNDYVGLDLGEITYITNIKNGVATVIYDPFDATKGGTLSGLTLTLAYNTTAMADTDPLQIITGFTPVNADPQLVKKVDSSNDIDNTALLQNISDNLDYLNLSLDQSEGIQINTREINPAKRDIEGAQIVSDGVRYSKTLAFVGDYLTVDTSGYASAEIVLTGIQALPNGTFVFEVSSDQVTWSAPIGMNYQSPSTAAASTAYSIASSGTQRYMVSTLSKFLRVRVSTLSAGPFLLVVVLKQAPLPLGPFTSLPVIVTGTAAANISQINSSTPNANAQNPNNSTQASAGGIGVAGHYVQTSNLPNAASTLQTLVPFPIGIGGREQPYIGALAGLFRYITVDGGGRYILGGDTPATETKTLSTLASNAIPGIPPRGVGGIPNNIVGAQSLTVTNVAQDFGDTQVMLMRQILTELKILNQQFAEMPNMLNNASYELSEPQEYRNDPTFDTNN